MIRYTDGNHMMEITFYGPAGHVLWLHLGSSVKLNFRPYIRQYTSPNKNFEYYPLIILAISLQNVCSDSLCDRYTTVNIYTLSIWTDKPDQTALTQIKLLLKELSDRSRFIMFVDSKLYFTYLIRWSNGQNFKFHYTVQIIFACFCRFFINFF